MTADRLAGCEVTFLPADPPRQGRFALYEPVPARGSAPRGSVADLPDQLEVAVPAANGARRRKVPARLLTVAEAAVALRDVPAASTGGASTGGASTSASAWSAVLVAGLVLVARGRLVPSVSATGTDEWRAGPLDPHDERLLADLAAAFPPAAYAAALPGRSPIRLPTPTALVHAAWDALADTLPRSAAAPVVTGSPLFSGREAQPAGHLRSWLLDASRGIEGGATVALRVELDGDEDELGNEGGAGHTDMGEDQLGNEGGGGGADGGAGAARVATAVLELTSRVEPSLVVDAADLFGSPAAVLARFGADAETDLLLALRRGARVWPPLEELLHQRAPASLALDEALLDDLLGRVPAELAAAGIEVRWPADLLAGGLALQATVAEQPGKVDEAGFSLADLVEFRWQATLDGELLSPEEIDQLAEAKRGLVRLRGRWVAADPDLLAILQERRTRRLTAGEALGALLAGTVQVDGQSVPVVGEGRVADLAGMLDRLHDGTGDGQTISAPAGLAAELRPYQERGVAWLAAMVGSGIGGCLADDMGLGKTIQVISLHLHRRSEQAGPTLVVCPTTLLANWEREVRRFAPDVPVRRYHGAGRNLDDLAPDELVVSSYGVARLDREALGDAGFGLAVADETHHGNNRSSETARALRAIKAGARVALTGTPVENRLSDLWAILDWTTPGLLGPLERFTRTVATPVERYRDPVATERLARTVRPFILRRRKTDPGIAPDLPPRTVTDVPVPLTSEQVTLYEAEVREALAKIRSKKGFERQGLVLRLLTVLKQICNHPAHYLHQAGPLPGRSGKFAALEELLGVIVAEGDQTLVFSQFVECLALVEARLADIGVPTLFLHGKVPAKRRASMVDEFQAGAVPVFLLSLKSAGVGLNLTGATHVVHVDRWWNPAVEDQATDRAHRIGQDRPVQVHRLIAEGTLEDRIAELIEKKRSLAEAVVGGGEAWIAALYDDDLAALVELGRP